MLRDPLVPANTSQILAWSLYLRALKLLIKAAISEGLSSRYNPLLSRTLQIDKPTIGNRCHVHFRRFRGRDTGQNPLS